MNEKKTYRENEEKQKIIHHINRVSGTLNGIKKMVEEDCYCDDILTQLKAAEKSLNSLSNHILEKHLYTCISKQIENDEILEELVGIFKRFNK